MYEENSYRKKSEIIQGIKIVLFSPLIIMFKLLSVVFKIIGGIFSVGLPYGIYCLYKVIEKLYEGVQYYQIKEAVYMHIFFVLPFVAFLVHFICDRIRKYLQQKLR